METNDAAALLMHDKRRRDAKAEKRSSKEDAFDTQLRQFKLPPFERGVLFAKEAFDRRFKFDFGNRQYMLAVEIEGLVVQRVAIATLNEAGRVIKIDHQLVARGRHASVDGFNDDCLKYAMAAALGWTVLRFTPTQVRGKVAIEYTQRVLAAKGWRR